MVATRRAIEFSYHGSCDIIEYEKIPASDGTTGFGEVTIQTTIPCRLSFESNPSTTDVDGASSVTQAVKILCSPDISIPSGCKMVVTQNGVTTAYQNSGKTAQYATHQEINLDIFEGWS